MGPRLESGAVIRIAWNVFLVWAAYKIFLILPPRRIGQLKEVAMFCAVCFLIMVVYKKWHGHKIVW